jgi:hypothetical protein
VDAIICVALQVHSVAAGKAAASRLQRAGWAGDDNIDGASAEADSAFEEQVPVEEAAMPLAVVTAVATPLPSAGGKEGSPLLQEEGQISTHLFNVELPSTCCLVPYDCVSLAAAKTCASTR